MYFRGQSHLKVWFRWPEVIAASTGHSAASTKVEKQYLEMLSVLGPEFSILRDVPIEEIKKISGRLTAEGIRRLREGKVERRPGFDGEYGTIRLFDQAELEETEGQLSLFTGLEMAQLHDREAAERSIRETAAALVEENRWEGEAEGFKENRVLENDESIIGRKAEETAARLEEPELNPQQKSAETAIARAIEVIAGPGTGKTKTLFPMHSIS